MIVWRTLLISESGQKLSPQPSERALLTITAAGKVRCWLIGGVDPDDSVRLKEIQEQEATVDDFDLRLVHWHPSTAAVAATPGQVIVHYSRGQQRIAYQPVSTTIKPVPLHLNLAKALKESTGMAQQSTSLHLLSTYSQQLTEETCLVDFKWPGRTEMGRAKLVMKMLPGWKDSRLVSKRCLCLIDPITGKVSARISSITAIYSLPESNEICLEGEAKWMLNDPKACPLCPRFILQFVMEEERWSLLKGLREAFEIINRPWSGLNNSNPSNVEMSMITINRDQSKDSGFVTQQISTLLPELFEAKPWCSLPFKAAYWAYQMLCQERSIPAHDELSFSRAGKGLGFCLKDQRGIVQEKDLNQGNTDSWYWYHVQLRS